VEDAPVVLAAEVVETADLAAETVKAAVVVAAVVAATADVNL
jgi:hypothetical protein